MAVFTRTTKNLIIRIDEFFDKIDLGLLVFKEALRAYLDKDFDAFERHLRKVDELENSADRLQREIENEMITHSVLPQHREEVVKLIDVLDEIIDSVKSSLIEIDIERPDIPSSLNKNLISLAETSANTAEELVPAARAYFRTPYTVREKLLKVYYFESETDNLSVIIKKSIFREMNDLDLAHKNQLRYMINHIENISDLAQKAADMLSGMAIKILI
jgi:predicted phosphate transport protein (TIGR00153 family)